MNKFLGIGRLVRDPELKGVATKFTIAIDRDFVKQGEQRQADFLSCVAFGKTGEFIIKYFKKGSRILIEGTVQTGSYEKDGKKVYTTDIIVDKAKFVDSKKSDDVVSDIPPTAVDAGFVAVTSEDDLPFN